MKLNTLLVKMHVRLKPGVLDPQGIATRQALEAMGYRGVEDVRVGKLIELRFHGKSRQAVEKEVAEMGKRILSNPVIETFDYEIEDA